MERVITHPLLFYPKLPLGNVGQLVSNCYYLSTINCLEYY
jgi:hypothetical protein